MCFIFLIFTMDKGTFLRVYHMILSHRSKSYPCLGYKQLNKFYKSVQKCDFKI